MMNLAITALLLAYALVTVAINTAPPPPPIVTVFHGNDRRLTPNPGHKQCTRWKCRLEWCSIVQKDNPYPDITVAAANKEGDCLFLEELGNDCSSTTFGPNIFQKGEKFQVACDLPNLPAWTEYTIYRSPIANLVNTSFTTSYPNDPKKIRVWGGACTAEEQLLKCDKGVFAEQCAGVGGCTSDVTKTVVSP